MRLHDSIGPNPRIVRGFARAKGLELERLTVDLMAGENRAPGQLALNPAGGLPILRLDDGTVIAEVTAICEYLEELHPEPALIGATPRERAETRMWVRRADLMFVEPLTLGFRATVGRPLFASRMALISEEAGRELMAHGLGGLAFLDRHMGAPHVCGGRRTLADLVIGNFARFLGEVGMALPEGLQQVPAMVQGLEADGLFPD